MGEILKTHDPRAVAQERKVDAAYAEYTRAAAEVSAIVERNAGVDPDRTHPEYAPFVKALAAKNAAETTWRREADKHAFMFINGV